MEQGGCWSRPGMGGALGMNNEEKILGMLEGLSADVSGMKNGMYSMNADIDRIKIQLISTSNEMSA